MHSALFVFEERHLRQVTTHVFLCVSDFVSLNTHVSHQVPDGLSLSSNVEISKYGFIELIGAFLCITCTLGCRQFF